MCLSVTLHDAIRLAHAAQTPKRHEGPVWEVEWLHPKFGNILASCSYDRKVLVWKEESQNQWQIIHQYAEHKLSGASASCRPLLSPGDRAPQC